MIHAGDGTLEIVPRALLRRWELALVCDNCEGIVLGTGLEVGASYRPRDPQPDHAGVQRARRMLAAFASPCGCVGDFFALKWADVTHKRAAYTPVRQDGGEGENPS